MTQSVHGQCPRRHSGRISALADERGNTGRLTEEYKTRSGEPARQCPRDPGQMTSPPHIDAGHDAAVEAYGRIDLRAATPRSVAELQGANVAIKGALRMIEKLGRYPEVIEYEERVRAMREIWTRSKPET